MRLGPLVPATALAAAVLLARCGGDDSTTTSNLTSEQMLQIAGVAELATNAYSYAGPGAIYDYLASQVTQHCSKAQLAQALAGEEAPSGFKRIKTVESDGTRATATIVQAFASGVREVQWVFVEERTGVWRLVSLPGLEKCS